jgi:predicted nucleic acid-binding protein
MCLIWAEVMESARRNGRPIECADAWIATTALLYEVPLVTSNARDFAGVNRLVVIGAEVGRMEDRTECDE